MRNPLRCYYGRRDLHFVPHSLAGPEVKGKPGAIPIRLESPLVAQSFLAVHSKDWPQSSWSYYEKGENGLIGRVARPPIQNFGCPVRRCLFWKIGAFVGLAFTKVKWRISWVVVVI
jgi:hypothetical protein